MKGAGVAESCPEPDFLTVIISVHPITTREEQRSSIAHLADEKSWSEVT